MLERGRATMTVDEFDTALSELETRVDRLRALYENWFRGYEKSEPAVARKEVERRVYTLRKDLPRNTALRFRYHQLYQRFTTLATYWQRTARQIEEGTYKLQLVRLKRRNEQVRPARRQPREGEEEKDQPRTHALDLDEISNLDDLLDAAELDEVGRALDAAPVPLAEPPRPVPAAPTAGVYGKPGATGPVSRPIAPGAAGMAARPGAPVTVSSPNPAASSPNGAIKPAAPAPFGGMPSTGNLPSPARPAAPPVPVVVRPAVPVVARPAVPVGAPPRAPAPAGVAAPPPAAPARPAPPARLAAQIPPASTIVGRPPMASPIAGAPASSLNEQRMKRIYDEYAAARRRNNEGEIRYEALVGSIQKMLPELSKKHQGKQIDFDVVVKDGRVGLRPKAT